MAVKGSSNVDIQAAYTKQKKKLEAFVCKHVCLENHPGLSKEIEDTIDTAKATFRSWKSRGVLSFIFQILVHLLFVVCQGEKKKKEKAEKEQENQAKAKAKPKPRPKAKGKAKAAAKTKGDKKKGKADEVPLFSFLLPVVSILSLVEEEGVDSNFAEEPEEEEEDEESDE